MIEFIIIGISAYLLGSIPTAVWIGKSMHNTDVREHGSKNAGATNTFRVLGKKAGSIVLLIDIAKGCLAVLLPLILGFGEWKTNTLVHFQLVAAVVAILGHVFPLFAGFRGGKGVATSLGIIIGMHPPTAAVCLGIFLIVFIAFSFVSLGAIVGAISFPLVLEFVFNNEIFALRIFSIVLCIAVVATHHKNIGRLLKGEENKMNLFKK